ncbi:MULTISPECIES: DEAD/DEAH box helicase [Flavobacteriaceae]|jgi:type III restriction enzyme|uniref:Type III restriction enzyme n=2 Tax=Flavobacteriaceae TaxID=49546 RepID=A0A1N6QH34_9FLAO|nr:MULTISPECIES: DEAD/DEAH box helicase family protein [Flavobacteriaceae]MDN3491295.1 DEAD/DEAH box helicase family protein [Winogradskyella bathintestinalis]SIQ15887.1 type III restriction enzyme [Maribacter ulvicola]|tara:strand:- start:3664 stop:6237 length:2574 start_codon:yes stop_codon:yes gene_type:complete
MIQEKKRYDTKDLILKVNQFYNQSELPLPYWDRFLDALCGTREYQKKAIRSSVIYLASKEYTNIQDLVSKNHYQNPQLRERYPELADYHRKLQLPSKLSATIDLATGTGKSYVMYGIAQILLGLGLVKRVLVLCPSTTIEKELHKKFLALVSDPILKETIPPSAIIRNPSIVDGSVTVDEGAICIENVHAVYERTGSSIEDSFGFKRGFDTVVLNDETHHIYNKISGNTTEARGLKIWKKFLLDDGYNFKYMLGFTGTAYIGNDYFNDVIYRYSLREAVDEKFVKKINYVSEDDSINEDQRFQKIYQNHSNNKVTYKNVKPLTILVTNNITNAKRLETRLVEFLMLEEGLEEQEVRDKLVMTVTSDKVHKHNVIRLEEVDEQDSTVEWIVSVSMLTEGWDVKNVFQIVPMEERAFNSKLLISQVLGRGLRVPPEYINNAEVTIFNHSSWGSKIKGLVDEVLELEMRLESSNLIDGDRSKFHFELYNIDYNKIEKAVENNSKEKEFNYKGIINLESSVDQVSQETTYTNLASDYKSVEYKIKNRMTPIKEIVDKIYHEFQTREWEGVTLKLQEGQYTKNNLPPKEEITKLIRRSMDKVGLEGDELNEKNKRNIFSSFNTLLRRKNKSLELVRIAQKPFVISTKERIKETLSIGNLRHNSTVMYSNNYNEEVKDTDVLNFLQEVIDDGTFPRNATLQANSYDFKTPVDLAFLNATPERKFAEKLVRNENSKALDAWLKSTNQSFYTIEYSLSSKSGNHTKQGKFNPDFFVKTSDTEIEYITVVEIKDDQDYSDLNKAKFKWATIHFQELNKQLEENNVNQRYNFHFLSPENYDDFFEYLRNGKLVQGLFTSNLDKELST